MNATKSTSKAVTVQVEGKQVTVTHLFRRRYSVAVEGKVIGYITSRDVLNAVGRVATVDSLKTLEGMMHKMQ